MRPVCRASSSSMLAQEDPLRIPVERGQEASTRARTPRRQARCRARRPQHVCGDQDRGDQRHLAAKLQRRRERGVTRTGAVSGHRSRSNRTIHEPRRARDDKTPNIVTTAIPRCRLRQIAVGLEREAATTVGCSARLGRPSGPGVQAHERQQRIATTMAAPAPRSAARGRAGGRHGVLDTFAAGCRSQQPVHDCRTASRAWIARSGTVAPGETRSQYSHANAANMTACGFPRRWRRRMAARGHQPSDDGRSRGVGLRRRWRRARRCWPPRSRPPRAAASAERTRPGSVMGTGTERHIPSRRRTQTPGRADPQPASAPRRGTARRRPLPRSGPGSSGGSGRSTRARQ